MEDQNLIHPHETRPGGPPADLSSQSQPAKLRWSAKHPPSDPTVSFAGKTVLVTGANTGLGFEAAQKYAALGADKLILAVRSASKGEAAKSRILQRTGRSADAIVVLTVDMDNFPSVQAFARTLEETTSRLDIALLNAGLGNPSYEKSSAGWEMAVQVNVLSTALMAVLLLPLLRRTADLGTTPHLTFVNSHGHDMVERDWFTSTGSLLKQATREDTWEPNKSYSMVKLLAMAVMQALAAFTAGASEGRPKIIVNAVCPDLCKTDLGRKFGVGSKIAGFFFMAIFARTAEEGARSLVSATALDASSHGRFWHHDILFP